MNWAYKRSRELARRLPSYRGEFTPGHPEFPSSSAAAVGVTANPTAISAQDLTYTAEDNKAIDTYCKKAVATAWHSVGLATPQSLVDYSSPRVPSSALVR